MQNHRNRLHRHFLQAYVGSVSKASFVVYIDESGDEGFKFRQDGRGSSMWFVIAGVVTRKATDLETMKLVDRVRVTIGKSKGAELHFRDLRHEYRLAVCQAIAEAPLRWIAIAVHKPSLKELAREHLYFYSCRFLLERVARFCASIKVEDGDKSADVIFSNKSSMSYDAFRDYLKKMDTVDRRIIPPGQIRSAPAAKLRGLQVADAVASGVWFSFTPRCGHTEPRYALMLHPRCDRNEKGKNSGFGLKIFPDAHKLGDDVQPLMEWARTHYGVRAKVAAASAALAASNVSSAEIAAGPGSQDPTSEEAAAVTDDLR